MKANIKANIAALLILIVSLTAFGCVEGKEFKAEPVALAKPAPEPEPVPLDKIIAGNDAAIVFAGTNYDALTNDKFLNYIINAKDRDVEERAKEAAAELAAASMRANPN